jgi:uroporphyrinogen-III decarboxylase
VKEVWDSFNAGHPIRVPIIFGFNARYFLLNKDSNPRGVTFRDYVEDPDVMFETQLKFWHWLRHNVPQDAEMGIPEGGWTLSIDFQNIYEAAWFGCPVAYLDEQVPDTVPLLTEDKKNILFDKGLPDPFSGIMEKNLSYYEYFNKRAKGFTFSGRPVTSVIPAAVGTDGPLTIAANLRGATELFMDFYEDPEFVHKLLDYVTEGTIQRIRAWWKLIGRPERIDNWSFADDSVQNISVEMYREFVMPYHRRLINALGGKGPYRIHLCGDASRHFLTLKNELDIGAFDTGFPIDLGEMRRLLGAEVRLEGGPSVNLLLNGTPEMVRAEVKRILTSGVMEGGNFIMREANNIAPYTPLENLLAMYESGKQWGGYN